MYAARLIANGYIRDVKIKMEEQRVFPPLRYSGRSREFGHYSEQQRGSVVYHWLFTHYGFREIDETCLGLNPMETKGWQSMGIAHYLGLVSAHKGFFAESTLDDALRMLLPQKSELGVLLIYCYLRDYGIREEVPVQDYLSDSVPEYATPALEGKDWVLKTLVAKTHSELQIDNGLLLMQTHADSTNREVTIRKTKYRYSDSAMKESMKCLYDYRCQICGMQIFHFGWNANYERKYQWQYMSADVHHIVPLSKGGADAYDNMLCVCPSCHRKFHTDEVILKEIGKKILWEDQVLGFKDEIKAKHIIHID
jgi:hypothetical protein